MARPSIQLQGGRRKPRRRSFKWVILLILLVAGAAAGGWWWSSRKARSAKAFPVAKNLEPTHTPPEASTRSSPPRPETNPVAPTLARLPSTPAITNELPLAVRPESSSRTLIQTNLQRINDASKPTDLQRQPDDQRWIVSTTDALSLQMALAEQGFSSGSLDGLPGAQTAAAIRAFQLQQGIEETGRPDPETLRRLHPGGRLLMPRTITAADFERLHPVPTTWFAKSQVRRLDFESILELVAEESHAHPRLIQRLNPDIDFAVISAGAVLVVPRVESLPSRRAALIRISLSQRWLRAYDDSGAILLHFPCSIGRIAEKRPVGTLHIAVTVKDPNYTFDPAVFPESPEAHQIRTKLIIPPGPNNPVGVAWIGLDRPGFGIHGPPGPEQVGRTESHGCFRLANWNAELLRQRVSVGTPVMIEL